MNTTGITIEHDVKGVPTFARIDLRKHGDNLKEFFVSQGISIDSSLYNPEFVAKIRRAENQKSKRIDLKNYGIFV